MKMAKCRARTCVSRKLASELVAGENRLVKFVARFSQVAHRAERKVIVRATFVAYVRSIESLD